MELVEGKNPRLSNAMTRVGNQTNSADPNSVHSRIFVGNLNTFLVSKDDLERIFQRYGRIIAISMHKGYAFVQYLDTWDARNAVVGEDGRKVAGQVLDVNMVSEPKPHQLGRKRQSTFSAFMSPKQSSVPPFKKARTEGPTRSMKHRHTYKSLLSHDGDILICGNCKEVMSGLSKFFEHKRQGCKLRFSCRCQQVGGAPPKPVCAKCGAVQRSWWELSQHLQVSHDIPVYVTHDVGSEDPMSSPDDGNQTDDITPASSIANGNKGDSSDWDMDVLQHLANGNNSLENGGTSQEISFLLDPKVEEKGVDTSDLGAPEEG